MHISTRAQKPKGKEGDDCLCLLNRQTSRRTSDCRVRKKAPGPPLRPEWEKSGELGAQSVSTLVPCCTLHHPTGPALGCEGEQEKQVRPRDNVNRA